MDRVLLRQSQQMRSRRTQDKILESTRELLENKWFSEISLGEIAEAAGCGVGTVYGRFANKDALLQILKEDFFRSTKLAHEAFFSSPDLIDAGLRQRVEKLISLIVDSYRKHRGIVRELVIGVHSHQSSEDRNTRSAMTELLERDIEFLLATFPAKRRRSWRQRVGLAMLAAINLIQNRVVFQETSPLVFALSDRDLKKEVPKIVIAYLSDPWGESENRIGK